jgi:hypothetical protein
LTLQVYVQPTRITSRCQLYDAYVEAEKTPIVAGSRDPEPDVCRMLVARGYDGPVQFISNGTCGLRVKSAAKFDEKRTVEGRRDGPYIGKYTPFERSSD